MHGLAAVDFSNQLLFKHVYYTEMYWHHVYLTFKWTSALKFNTAENNQSIFTGGMWCRCIKRWTAWWRTGSIRDSLKNILRARGEVHMDHIACEAHLLGESACSWRCSEMDSAWWQLADIANYSNYHMLTLEAEVKGAMEECNGNEVLMKLTLACK